MRIRPSQRAFLPPPAPSSRSLSPQTGPPFLPRTAVAPPAAAPLQLTQTFFTPSRREAQLRHTLSDVVEFRETGWRLSPEEIGLPGHGPPPDERTLKLGKTLRILQSRLPSVLASPLPQDILSPHISLHLFPSTHPHLPNVTGRVAYHAALWTSPVTWGRVPLIGSVRLKIVSERMVKHRTTSHNFSSSDSGSESKGGTPVGESLIVRWKTCEKENGNSGSQVLGKMAEWLGRDPNSTGSNGFEGLFIFEFDEEGRILSHTIERAEQGGSYDEGVGKWVGLTDWLLGRIGGAGEPQPGLALGYVRNCSDPKRRRFGRGSD